MTEHEKYALGATKPGGFAAQGFNEAAGGGGGASSSKPSSSPGQAVGLQFLSTRPPWACSICNVNCTSRDTLMSHAAGVKHVRRAKAATAAANKPSDADGASKPAEAAAATVQVCLSVGVDQRVWIPLPPGTVETWCGSQP